MNVNLKKMKKPLILTLLVFSLGAFCVYQTARSKYYSNDDKHLVYDVEYKTMDSKGVSLDVDPETTIYPNVLGFVGTFYRSNYVLETDEAVKYKFEVDAGCTISSTSVNSEHAQLNVNATNPNIATLIYNKNFIMADLEEPINVKYTCPASAINVVGRSTFKVKEQFQPEGAEDYESKVYNLGSAFKTFKSNILFVPKTYPGSIYDYLVQDSNFLVGEESDYLATLYNKNNITDTNPDTMPSLPGFTVREDETHYIYEKGDNFTSYAYTYESYIKGGSSLWFLNDQASKEDINALFIEYMGWYYSSLDAQDKADLIEYVTKSKVSLKDVLDGKGNIGGLYHGGARFIAFEPNIMLYVHPPVNIEVNYNLYDPAKPGDYSKLLPYISQYLGTNSVFGTKVSSTNLASIRSKILPTLSAQPSVETYTYLGPYVDSNPNVGEYTPQTVIVVVHSVPGSTAGSGIHYVSIIEVEPEKEYGLFFSPVMTTSDGVSSVNYSATVSKINTVLATFKTDVVVTESMLTNPTESDPVYIEPNTGIITVTFTTPKLEVIYPPAADTPVEDSPNEESQSEVNSAENENPAGNEQQTE